MVRPRQATPDVPYPAMWLVPQWRTEEVLRNRLSQLGQRIEWGTEAIGIEQDHASVAVRVRREGIIRTIQVRYVVGTDGGRSFVRKTLGAQFIGSTSQEGRMIVGDIRADGLARDSWHIWPAAKGGLIGLCPLPNSDLFQLMMNIDATEGEPELSEQAIQARWLAATGLKKIRLHDPTWMSLFRHNVRLVDRYRDGRVFLAGDAAHVHTPSGAQGLNTGIQDAYNLGWKLALILNGAPDSLLDTYQEERMPVAAAVLKLSTKLTEGINRKRLPKLIRGDKERQLLLNYRNSSLAVEADASYRGKLRAGDRAPDAPGCRHSSEQIRLFDVFRGTHFTLLVFGSKAIEAVRNFPRRYEQPVRVVAVLPTPNDNYCETLVDDNRYVRRAYGVSDEDNITFLVRPDGYVGHIACSRWELAIEEYLAAVVGAYGEPEPLGAARMIATDRVDTPSRTRL